MLVTLWVERVNNLSSFWLSSLQIFLLCICHRLYLLVKMYGGVQVAEYSSSLSPPQRKGILRDFRLGKLQLLICSDAMARGMDIQDVCYVISYDVPNYVRTYIHRVGRTARAGNKGNLAPVSFAVATQCLSLRYVTLRQRIAMVDITLLLGFDLNFMVLTTPKFDFKFFHITRKCVMKVSCLFVFDHNH